MAGFLSMQGLYTDAFGLHVIEAHSLGLIEVAARTPLDRPVPTCGEWTLADLVWHLGEVQDFWAWIIENRPSGPDRYPRPTRPDDGRLVEDLERASGSLLDALAGVDPEEPAWSWSEDQTVGFSLRRQSHEALVHHVDGILAAGLPVVSVDPLLAADGVDEMINVTIGGIPSWATFTPSGQTIGLRATDTGDRWTLGLGRMAGTSPDTGTAHDLEAVEPVDAEPSVVVAAPAFALDLWLWGRQPDSAVSIEGDADLVRDLRRIIVDASQ